MDTEDRIENVSLMSLPVNSTTEKFRNLSRPGGTIRNCRWLSIICLVLLMACGYKMAGKETHVPAGLSSIAIPTFKNKTFEPGIEIPFTQAFLNEFIQDRRVKVVSRAEADSILEGVVTDFIAAAGAYDRSGFVLQYVTAITVDLSLKDRAGKVLWHEGVSETQWFRASSSGVTNEAAKQIAIQKTAGVMAERIRNRFFYNF
ncbi:MAG: LptE family protein [Thermodesulfobacteriota bacterium]